MRLDKYLSDMGIGTRSEIKKSIRSGLVTVDGHTVSDPGIHVTSDIVDLITGQKRRDLFPVGRLDRDTEGLLIITNDGEMAHRLLSPRHHVDKRYFARVTGRVTDETAEAFASGLVLSDGLECLPADLTILKTTSDAEAGGSDPDRTVTETEVTIREGKFHQIKRMFLAAGHEVIYLKRLTMGPLTLDPDLEPGEYRRLTEDEITRLKAI